MTVTNLPLPRLLTPPCVSIPAPPRHLPTTARALPPRQAEQEVAALEATLNQLVAANGGYGSSFRKVDSKTAFKERAALREKLDKAYDKLKFRRGEEGSLVADLQQAEARLTNLAGEQRRCVCLGGGGARSECVEPLRAGRPDVSPACLPG